MKVKLKTFQLMFYKKVHYLSFLNKIEDVIGVKSNKFIYIIWLFLTFPYALFVGFICEIIGKMYSTMKKKEWKRKKYELAIVSIAKNESESILEWISFHKAVGYDHIYLYDNESNDNLYDVIEPFIRNGFVTYNLIKGSRMQMIAYNLALKDYGKECSYMAFIDCDELLFPVDHHEKLKSIVNELFSKDMNVGGIAVNWAMYGSSGHKTKPKGFMIENYIWRAKLPEGRGTECVKTIVNPDVVSRYVHCHYPRFIPGFYNMSCDGKVVGDWKNPIDKYTKLRINHYFTKSKEHWECRIKRGQASLKKPRTWEEFYAHDNNDIKDDSAMFYVDKMNSILNEMIKE